MPRAVRLALLLLLLLAAPARAVELPVDYRATVTVQGGWTITQREDTLATCYPGQKYTLVHDVDLDLRTGVRVVATSKAAVGVPTGRAQGGKVSARVEGYKETNHCPPDLQEPLIAPPCRSYSAGRMQSALSTPGRRTWLGLIRKGGGGTQAGECDTPSISVVPSSAKLTGMDEPVEGATIPLELSPRSIKTLGRGKKLIRVMRIDGTCDQAYVYRGPRLDEAIPQATERCTVTGVLNAEIKRR